jgi:hypothetical protein
MSTPTTNGGSINLTPSWVRQSFLVNAEWLSATDQNNRFFSDASLKYTDTTPGGNHAINPPPQFTRYADPKAGSRFAGSKGLGIYYSEAIDDHSQIIHMRFGVPEFNSMTQFFTNFYNTGAATVARTGRDPHGIMYNIGRAAFTVVAVMFWPLAAIHIAAMALRFIIEKPATKYYYLKPTMPVYWQVVQTIVNQIAVNKGIIQRQVSSPATTGTDPLQGDPNWNQGSDLANSYQFDSGGVQAMNNLAMQMQLPDIFTPGGGIDVYAMANRAKRLEQAQIKAYYQALNDTQGGTLDIGASIQQIFSPSNMLTDTNQHDFLTYLDKWRTTPAGQASSSETSLASDASNDASTEAIDPNKSDYSSQSPGLGAFYQAELDDGGAFVSFRVNATGAVTDSFQNQPADSDLANKINSMSSQSRSTRFDIENGDISDNFFAKAAGHVLDNMKDVVAGVADGFHMSGLAALGGSALVDIPKHWQSASANLSRSTYTMNLVSPYGNPISQLINLYIPVAMLIAGALPLATGQQSYTSPFICELYDRGRCQIRLGMIDSLQITRGTSNLPFDEIGNAMAIDVSFTVLDLSNLVYLPISQGMTSATSSLLATLGGVLGGVGAVADLVSGSGAAAAVSDVQTGSAVGAEAATVVDGAANIVSTLNGLFDGDNPFADYMAVLGGLGMADQIYAFRRLKLNLTMQMAQWRNWKSPARYASVMGDVFPARLIRGFFTGVDNN